MFCPSVSDFLVSVPSCHAPTGCSVSISLDSMGITRVEWKKKSSKTVYVTNGNKNVSRRTGGGRTEVWGGGVAVVTEANVSPSGSEKWFDWIDGGVAEGLWLQWWMRSCSVGARDWVTNGCSDWSGGAEIKWTEKPSTNKQSHTNSAGNLTQLQTISVD